jgi:hypothetical protein
MQKPHAQKQFQNSTTDKPAKTTVPEKKQITLIKYILSSLSIIIRRNFIELSFVS